MWPVLVVVKAVDADHVLEMTMSLGVTQHRTTPISDAADPAGPWLEEATLLRRQRRRRGVRDRKSVV